MSNLYYHPHNYLSFHIFPLSYPLDNRKMMFKSALVTTLVASIASMVNAADLSGSARITPQDYYGLRK